MACPRADVAGPFATVALNTALSRITRTAMRAGLSYSGPGADDARFIWHQFLLECIPSRVGFRSSGIDLLLQSFRQGNSPRRVETIAVVAVPVPACRADIRRDHDAIVCQGTPPPNIVPKIYAALPIRRRRYRGSFRRCSGPAWRSQRTPRRGREGGGKAVADRETPMPPCLVRPQWLFPIVVLPHRFSCTSPSACRCPGATYLQVR